MIPRQRWDTTRSQGQYNKEMQPVMLLYLNISLGQIVSHLKADGPVRPGPDRGPSCLRRWRNLRSNSHCVYAPAAGNLTSQRKLKGQLLRRCIFPRQTSGCQAWGHLEDGQLRVTLAVRAWEATATRSSRDVGGRGLCCARLVTRHRSFFSLSFHTASPRVKYRPMPKLA